LIPNIVDAIPATIATRTVGDQSRFRKETYLVLFDRHRDVSLQNPITILEFDEMDFLVGTGTTTAPSAHIWRTIARPDSPL
jgi:hypothetical protein